jgi:hypothetical protein
MNSSSKILYVFGDSFSTPYFCVEPKDSFWGLAARDLDVDYIVNYSKNGMAFDVIIHLLLNEKFDWGNGYFIVGVPPLARMAFLDDRDPPRRHQAKQFDKNFHCFDVGANSMTNLIWEDYFDIFGKEKFFVQNYNHEWIESKNLEKIYLLHNFLKNQADKFLIVNLTAPILYQPQWELGENIMHKCNDLKECILFKNTMHDVNKNDNIEPVDRASSDVDKWFGHHGPVGNKNWYKKILLNKMRELSWL